MESKLFWHFDAQTKIAVSSTAQPKYHIRSANEEDKSKVVTFYAICPVPGYDIASMEVIYNPRSNRVFALELERLQEKKGNPAFLPQWQKMTGVLQRQQVIDQWITLTQPYTDPQYPAVKLVPGWHGTRPELLDSIFRVAYSNLSYTNEGFFSKRLYAAYEAKYAYEVYSQGALLLNWIWIASFATFPVIQGDMALLKGKSNYGHYDTHFVPVVPKKPHNPHETVYYPCGAEDKAMYHEIVGFQTSTYLPRYLVQLQKTLLKAPIMVKKPASPQFTWAEVFALAAGVMLEQDTDLLHLYFPVPAQGYWTTWQEQMTQVYESLQPVTEGLLQQAKTPDDQTQILSVKPTPTLLALYQAHISQEEGIQPIDPQSCIIIHRTVPTVNYHPFFAPNLYEKQQKKLVTALQMQAKPQMHLLPYRDDKHNSFLRQRRKKN